MSIVRTRCTQIQKRQDNATSSGKLEALVKLEHIELLMDHNPGSNHLEMCAAVMVCSLLLSERPGLVRVSGLLLFRL